MSEDVQGRSEKSFDYRQRPFISLFDFLWWKKSLYFTEVYNNELVLFFTFLNLSLINY